MQSAIPWVAQLLSGLPKQQGAEKQPVLDCWIRDQKAYHERALAKAEARNMKNERIARVVVWFTILIYAAALVFELAMYSRPAEPANAEWARVILKILMGTMSATTLLTNSYYGKMSLPQAIEDHKRMISLYGASEQEILKNGETEELLLSLAREFLNENSTWYAYQTKNQPELIL